MLRYNEEIETGMEDLGDLSIANNATLLKNIKNRYFFKPKQIYTYISPSLVAINPYEKLPHLNTKEIVDSCMMYMENMKMTLKDIPPHIYSIAAHALKKMYTTHTKQAIIMNGESGSGKTEATKIAMSFLLGSITSKPGGIVNQILSCHSILEAFGHAKTLHNNNSSRFAKYIKIMYNVENKTVIGAIIKPYLLEKCRVTNVVISNITID